MLRALDRNGEAFLPAQDRQRHEGPLLAAHLCARPCHAEVKRFFALDLGDDIAGEQSGLLAGPPAVTASIRIPPSSSCAVMVTPMPT